MNYFLYHHRQIQNYTRFDAEAGRWRVVLDNGEEKLIRPANLVDRNLGLIEWLIESEMLDWIIIWHEGTIYVGRAFSSFISGFFPLFRLWTHAEHMQGPEFGKRSIFFFCEDESPSLFLALDGNWWLFDQSSFWGMRAAICDRGILRLEFWTPASTIRVLKCRIIMNEQFGNIWRTYFFWKVYETFYSNALSWRPSTVLLIEWRLADGRY